MKKIIPIFLMLAMAVACEKDVDTIPVSVYLQAQFEQDHVKVTVDEKILVDQTVQTNHSLGVCHIGDEMAVQTKVKEGTHQLRVVINETLIHATEFNVADDLFIGINYDRTTQAISFIYSDEPFAYD